MVIVEFLKEYYTVFFVWLTCLTAIFIYRKTLPFSYRWFALLIILLSILETIANAIGFSGIRDHFFFNIIFAIELTLLPLFFKYWLHLSAVKKIIQGFLFIFPVLVLVNTLWVQGFYTLQTYTYVFGGTFVLILSIVYLWELYSNEEVQIIFHNPVFWFSLAYFLYFAVSIPYFGMMNYLWTTYPSFTKLYYLIIMDGTICLYNILLTIGFLCMRPTTK